MILLSSATQKMIEDRMKRAGYESADELVRVALQTLDQVQAEDFEQLDPETQRAIEEGEEQYQGGEGMTLNEAFARLREKYRSE
jgi:Arc/MetJ-type ribon-helix-helix transcriptional regulator